MLGVSVSTSKRLHSLLIGGAFERIERMVKHAVEREEIDRTIARMVRVGLPANRYVLKKRKK